MFVEAWRLERDYFYDRAHARRRLARDAARSTLPLVDRVTDRDELADLLGQMVSELSALHIFVYGGDLREGPDDDRAAHRWGPSWSATRRPAAIASPTSTAPIPTTPMRARPLARPGVDVREGDVIESRQRRRHAVASPDPSRCCATRSGARCCCT